MSGDKQSIVTIFANKLGITQAYGDLLPEGKVEHIERLKEEKGNQIAFVGDGMNDAPVLALSDVGIAMGGLGSDAAIETADVVIQTDQPSKVATAIKVGRYLAKCIVGIWCEVVGADFRGKRYSYFVGSCLCGCWCYIDCNNECCSYTEND